MGAAMKQTGRLVRLSLFGLLCAALATSLSACGKRGPLYLPADKVPKTQQAPASQTSIAPQDKPVAEDTDKDLPVTSTDKPQP